MCQGSLANSSSVGYETSKDDDSSSTCTPSRIVGYMRQTRHNAPEDHYPPISTYRQLVERLYKFETSLAPIHRFHCVPSKRGL